MWPRNHSADDSAAASVNRRNRRGVHSSRAATKPTPVNIARPAGNMVTANGSSHPNVLASTRKAEPIQYSPARKYPNPNHQPIAKAAPMPSDRAVPVPSSSQTSGGKVTNMTGQKLIGATARIDAAPAPNTLNTLRP